jgi:hypothetical protein
MMFWVPWGIALIVTALFLYFFVIGLADGSVSSFNIALWMVILLGVASVTGGSLLLKNSGRPGLAILLALVLAVPGLLALIFLLAVLITTTRWN